MKGTKNLLGALAFLSLATMAAPFKPTTISPFKGSLTVTDFIPQQVRLGFRCTYGTKKYDYKDTQLLVLGDKNGDSFPLENTKKLSYEKVDFEGRTVDGCGPTLKISGIYRRTHRVLTKTFYIEASRSGVDITQFLKIKLENTRLIAGSRRDKERKLQSYLAFFDNERVRDYGAELDTLVDEYRPSKNQDSYFNLNLGSKFTYSFKRFKEEKLDREVNVTVSNSEQYYNWIKVDNFPLWNYRSVWLSEIDFEGTKRLVFWNGSGVAPFVDFGQKEEVPWEVDRAWGLGPGTLWFGKPKTVNVAAGKYEDTKTLKSTFRSHTNYFAKGLGLVKEVRSTSDGTFSVTELTKVEAVANPVAYFTSTEAQAKHYAGATSCLSCHDGENAGGNYKEWWKKTEHYGSTEYIFPEVWEDSVQQKFAKAVGLTKETAQQPNSLCLSCHGTPGTLSLENKLREKGVPQGVSCESCHGGVGRTDRPNWLTFHQTNPDDKHYSWNKAVARTTGWLQPADVYSIAKKCIGCHVPRHEKLVNVGHGGSYGSFELVEYMSGQIRHNFEANGQKENANASTIWKREIKGDEKARKRLLYLTALAVDIEWIVYNISQAEKSEESGRFCESNIERLSAKMVKLDDAMKALGDDNIIEELDEIYALVGEQAQTIEDKKCQWQEEAYKIYIEVQQYAKKFAAKYNGEGWEKIDPILEKIKPVGEPFKPL